MGTHTARSFAEEKRMKERWRTIAGFEGLYEVSDQGRVYRNTRIDSLGRAWKAGFLAQALYKEGYKRVMLRGATGSKFAAVHCLMLEAFIGPRPPGHEGAHLNGKSTDNKLRNLAWKTPKDNCKDRLAHGTHLQGERIGTSKLNTRSVRCIRSLYATGNFKQVELGRLFGVHQAHISTIVLGKWWTHV